MNDTNPNLESTLAKLAEHGRIDHGGAEFSDATIQKWESEFAIRFPKSFACILTGGAYDIANFYFMEPALMSVESAGGPGEEYVAFARWNEDRFAFRRSDLELSGPDNPAVYVLLNDEPPLKRYADFPAWFIEVAALADRPVNPE